MLTVIAGMGEPLCKKRCGESSYRSPPPLGSDPWDGMFAPWTEVGKIVRVSEKRSGSVHFYRGANPTAWGGDRMCGQGKD